MLFCKNFPTSEALPINFIRIIGEFLQIQWIFTFGSKGSGAATYPSSHGIWSSETAAAANRHQSVCHEFRRIINQLATDLSRDHFESGVLSLDILISAVSAFPQQNVRRQSLSGGSALPRQITFLHSNQGIDHLTSMAPSFVDPTSTYLQAPSKTPPDLVAPEPGTPRERSLPLIAYDTNHPS